MPAVMVPAAMPAVTLLDMPANSSATAKMVELAGPRMGESVSAATARSSTTMAFEVHGLDDLGVQKKVVWHNDRTQDTNDNRGRASGHTGRDPACGGLRPVDLD